MTTLVEKAREAFVRLGRAFLPTQVKKNPKGQDYISIADTINRLNEDLGHDWDLRWVQSSVTPLTDRTYGRKQAPAYLAEAVVEITALGATRCGMGADWGDDPDKVYKTAQAEALKKAGHQFGIGLYLWSEDERANVAEGQAAASGDLQSLKNQVFKLALSQGLSVQTPAGIAAHFKLAETDLQDAGKLTAILKEAGKL